MKSKKINFGINIGTSSLLLVFVILCLISFATLSIVSSNADKRLNDTVIERQQEYYDACSQANQRLEDLDNTLKSSYESSADSSEYFSMVGDHVSFCIEISDNQVLQVEADINYPINDGDSFYTVTCWETQTISSLELDDSLDVMQFDE